LPRTTKRRREKDGEEVVDSEKDSDQKKLCEKEDDAFVFWGFQLVSSKITRSTSGMDRLGPRVR